MIAMMSGWAVASTGWRAAGRGRTNRCDGVRGCCPRRLPCCILCCHSHDVPVCGAFVVPWCVEPMYVSHVTPGGHPPRQPQGNVRVAVLQVPQVTPRLVSGHCLRHGDRTRTADDVLHCLHRELGDTRAVVVALTPRRTDAAVQCLAPHVIRRRGHATRHHCLRRDARLALPNRVASEDLDLVPVAPRQWHGHPSFRSETHWGWPPHALPHSSISHISHFSHVRLPVREAGHRSHRWGRRSGGVGRWHAHKRAVCLHRLLGFAMCQHRGCDNVPAAGHPSTPTCDHVVVSKGAQAGARVTTAGARVTTAVQHSRFHRPAVARSRLPSHTHTAVGCLGPHVSGTLGHVCMRETQHGTRDASNSHNQSHEYCCVDATHQP